MREVIRRNGNLKQLDNLSLSNYIFSKSTSNDRSCESYDEIYFTFSSIKSRRN